jgi:hypothetical protein
MLVECVEVVVGKNTTPLLTDAQPLLSGQVLMVCQLQWAH